MKENVIMKKYVKPELFYESFELSQQIASCDYDYNKTVDDAPGSSCYFTWDVDPNVTVFVSGNCKTPIEGYCYHGSTGNMYILFNS
jgi:hypothetical protein